MEKVTTKRCAKCHKELSTTCFSKRSSAKDGLNCYCRDCVSIISRQSRLKKLRSLDKSRPLKDVPLEEPMKAEILEGIMDTHDSSEVKWTKTKVVTVRLFGIKILTLTTEMLSL